MGRTYFRIPWWNDEPLCQMPTACKGFPCVWTFNAITPIHKTRDPMSPSIYKTIMIGHVMSYAVNDGQRLMDSKLGDWQVSELIIRPLTIYSPSEVSSRMPRHDNRGFTVALWISAKPLTQFRELDS